MKSDDSINILRTGIKGVCSQFHRNNLVKTKHDDLSTGGDCLHQWILRQSNIEGGKDY